MTHFSDTRVRATATSDLALPAASAPAYAPPSREAVGPRRPAAPSPLEVALLAVGDGYKAHLVWQLFWGARPFCHLMRRIPGITRKALRSRLGEMERAGLVTRRIVGGGHRRAEYGLTPLGETLKPIVGGMYEWGLRNSARPAGGAARPQDGPDAPTRIAMSARPADLGAA